VSFEDECVLAARRWNGSNEILSIFNFKDREVRLIQSIPYGVWRKRLDSHDPRWMGNGSRVPEIMESVSHGSLTLPPHGVVLFEKEVED